MPIKDAFYEAAIIPELWPKAANVASNAWNTDAVSLIRFSGACSGLATSQGAESLGARYVEEGWYKSDVRAERAISALRKGKKIVTEADLFRSDEIRRLPFYSDFLHKAGFGWFAASLLCEVDGIIMGLSIDRLREKGPFAQDDLALVERHLPHLRKACELASINRLGAANGIVANLDHLGCGAILLDWLGRVIGVNKKAEAYIDSCLHVIMSRLHMADQAANKALQDYVAASVQPNLRAANKPLESLVAHRPDNQPLVLTSYPVVRNASDVFQGAAAILVIKDPEEAPTISGRVLKDAFRFTPTEQRVASLLLSSLNTEDIAAELGVGKEAIRFHLKSMFAKTGTSQQSQLVNLLMRLSRNN